jgi:hypothetical protein
LELDSYTSTADEAVLTVTAQHKTVERGALRGEGHTTAETSTSKDDIVLIYQAKEEDIVELME